MALNHGVLPARPRLVREVPGARKPVPARALVLSAAALGTATWGAFSNPDLLAGYDALSWLLLLIPAFLLAYYRGWQGTIRVLAAGSLTLLLLEFAAAQLFGVEVNWTFLVLVAVVLLAFGIGLGVLSELLHRERLNALGLAYSDPLTELANRQLLDFVLEREFAEAERGQPFSVVLFDVDRFKLYNERYGYAAGDEGLRHVAAHLQSTTRSANLCGRYGADEFLTVLSGETPKGAATYAERACRNITKSELGTGQRLTLSAGVASYDPSMGSPSDVVTAAQKALDSAKARGGGYSVCDAASIERSEAVDAAARATAPRSTFARDRRRRAVQEVESRHHDMFRDAPVGLYRATLGGQILAANPALVTMLGYRDLASLLRVNFAELYADRADRDAWESQMGRAGLVRDFETRFRKFDGGLIWVRESARAVTDSKGSPLYYEGVLQDITQHRQLEAQLRQSQKMESLGQLAGGIAHDFNNLLTAILTHCDLLLPDLEPGGAHHQEVEGIRQTAERAASLTGQLLAFSRKQSQRLLVLDLNAVIAGVETMLRRLIHREIELVISTDPNPCYIKADPGQIEQLIVNLVVNARDAMPVGGRLAITTTLADLSVDPFDRTALPMPGPHVRLTVSDTGLGMDEDTKARIFEPFFTTKDKAKGTGLGLSVVYGIVQRCGGHVAVESTPGTGTTFTVHVPRIDEPGELNPTVRAEGMKVLDQTDAGPYPRTSSSAATPRRRPDPGAG